MGLTDILEAVSREAARVILEVYSDESLFAISYKLDQSPVTLADQRSDAVIQDLLADAFPHIPVISEESPAAPFEDRKDYRYCFLVDPLDGTREFIQRNDSFVINIALVEHGRPVASVVMMPVTGACYGAEYGQGAWRRLSADVEREPIRSHSFSLAEPGVRVLASRSHPDPATLQLFDRLEQPEIMRLGSAIKFLRLAEGAADFYPRLAPIKEWDTAAPQLILEEAGGAVVRWPDLEPLRYNQADLTHPGFVAFGRMLDPEVLRGISML